MKSETLTRYHLRSGDSRMSVLLDRSNLSIGAIVTLADSENVEQFWEVTDKLETVDRAWIKRAWNNNI